MGTSRIRRLFRLPSSAGTLSRDIDEEIAFHIEARTKALIDAGAAPEAARRRAELEFGDVAAARAELAAIDRVTLRRERRSEWLDVFIQDARLALSTLRRSPGFALTVVLTLALGIGVNAAMFAIADRLLLRAPPHVVDGDEVVRVLVEYTPRGGERTLSDRLPYPDYALLRSVEAFEEVGASMTSNAVLGRGEGAREIRTGVATATFFRLLGARPALGRFFSSEEDALPRGRRVTVLSYDAWQGRFGGNPEVVGTTVEIDHRPYEVVGVAPRGFTGVGLEPVHAWIPVSAKSPDMAGENWHTFQGMHYLQVVARLRAGVEPAAAQEAATIRFRAGNESAFLGDSAAAIKLGSVIPARAPAIGEAGPQRSGRVAMWLFGVSLLVVLIACVNVINLLLSRGIRRRREIGVRRALGIGGARLAGQAVAETVLLSVLAAALGLVLAHWFGRLTQALLLPDAGWAGSLVDGRVVLFAGAVTLVCAFGASLLPVLHAARTDVTTLLGPGNRSTHGSSRARSSLVALQATLSVLLLVGAGLFLSSLRQAGDIALGYDPERVAVLSWHTAGLDWHLDRELDLYDRALRRVAALPQVQSASLSTTQPLWGTMYGYVHVPGLDSVPTSRDILFTAVSPDYFRTVGARMIEGRGFTAEDARGSAPVAILTASLARLLWSAESGVGKCVMTASSPDSPCREVVGVVEDTRYDNVLGEPSLMFYLPLEQAPRRGWMGGVFVRLHGDGWEGLSAVRSTMQSLEPGLPHLRATPLSERVAPALRPWRVGAVLFTSFGVLALILAGLGLYGIVAYEVTQRQREMAVRRALGARAPAVVRMVLGKAVRVVLPGLLLGLVVGWIGGRFLEPLLYGVSATDPFVHTAVVLLLLGVTALAVLVPAWRASRVQPVEALRED